MCIHSLQPPVAYWSPSSSFLWLVSGWCRPKCFRFAHIVYCAMLVLVIYDYAITLYREVTWIWLRKWTFATWIFLANRYLTITAVLFVATRPTAQVRILWFCGKKPTDTTIARGTSPSHDMKSPNNPSQSCDGWWITIGALESAQYFIFAGNVSSVLTWGLFWI